MFNPRVGYEESRTIGYVVHSKWSNLDRSYAQNFQKSQDIASYIAGLRSAARRRGGGQLVTLHPPGDRALAEPEGLGHTERP